MYEKQYNKDVKGGYNKGGKQRNPVPIKPLLSFLLLLTLIIVLFSYRKPIVSKFAEWRATFEENSRTYTDESIEYDEDLDDIDILEQVLDEDLLDMVIIEEPKDIEDKIEPEEARESKTTLNDFSSNQPKSATSSISEPKDIEKPVKGEDLSKHRFERYIDRETNKYGLRDLTANKILIEPIYDEIKPLAERQKVPYAIVRKGKLWGVVTVKNETIVPLEYRHIDESYVKSNVFLSLTKTNESGKTLRGYAKMPDAKIIIPAEYGSVTAITHDYTFFKVSNSIISPSSDTGIIDWNNNMIFAMEYDYVGQTRIDGYVTIQIRTKDDKKPFRVGLVGLRERKLLVPIEYEELSIMGPVSFIKVKKDGKYGCINHRNEVVVPIIHGGGGGSKESSSDPTKNIIYFNLPNGEEVAYNVKGEKVPFD